MMALMFFVLGIGLCVLAIGELNSSYSQPDRKTAWGLIVVGAALIIAAIHSIEQPRRWQPPKELTVVKTNNGTYIALDDENAINIYKETKLQWDESWTIELTRQEPGWYGLVYWDSDSLTKRYHVYDKDNRLIYGVK